MSPSIFINYRRALSTMEARLLYLMLQFKFPGEVFLDELEIAPGDRWRPEIENKLQQAKVVLSLIPDGWLEYQGELKIQSKLIFDPNCHVKKELEMAINQRTPIIPILTNGTQAPDIELLPECISDLFENQCIELKFEGQPNIEGFKQLFDKVAQLAGLDVEAIREEDDNLFQVPLEEEYPLPSTLLKKMPKVASPYVGLYPFKKENARIFFGRSREIFQWCFKILKGAPQVLLLDGYSGTGKSSLLQAGLIPRIEQQGWKVLYGRREQAVNGLPGVLQQLIKKSAKDPRPSKLFIIDQVEEAITDVQESNPDELNDFIQAFAEYYVKHDSCKFILSFRSEYKARISKVLRDAGVPFDDNNTLFPLDRTGAIEAISGAAEDQDLSNHFRFTFARGSNIPARITDCLLKGNNYQIAPLIQVNMELIWQKSRQPDGSIVVTRQALDRLLENQEALLDHYLEKVKSGLPENATGDRELLHLLDQYIRNEPASAIRSDLEVLREETFAKDEKLYNEILKELKAHYLLTEVTHKGEIKTRLSHDVLARYIREKYQQLTEAQLEATEEKLDEVTLALFEEKRKNLHAQLYAVQFIEAHNTLRDLMDLGVRLDTLVNEFLEIAYIWDIAGRKGFLREAKKWLMILKERYFRDFDSVLPDDWSDDKKYSTNLIRSLLQLEVVKIDLKYLAPKQFAMHLVPGGNLEISVKEKKRTATISSFQIAKTQTTWAQYSLYLYASGQEELLNKKAPIWGIKADHPVVNVSWYEAIEYCNWLSEASGLSPVYKIHKDREDPNNLNEDDELKFLVEIIPEANGYRLPYDIEWKYAAKGGQLSKGFKYAGSNDLNEVGWFNENANGSTQPVGKKKANELDLYDMSGNVWEWCWDWFSFYPENLPIGYKGIEKGKRRLVSGGSWGSSDNKCRMTVQIDDKPSNRDKYVGFRLAQD